MAAVLWWGRFDPDYSRNRILRGLLAELGWRVADFYPRLSALADWEAMLRRLPRPDLVWVPCFRQRDLAAASRWARARDVPLLFDPLISAYDKQVDERGKFPADSERAHRLLAWEQGLFRRADVVLADTPAHAEYFAEVLGAERARLHVVYVGAEEALFRLQPSPGKPAGAPLEALFFGSFIPLQGPEVIVEAARLYRGPPVKWTLLGQGPLRKSCEEQAEGLVNVAFEEWLPYADLPARIARAGLLLGVFGTTPKAGRVIPNKVFQAMSCGKPVLTRRAAAYPVGLEENSGLVWVEAGDAAGLAARVAELASAPERLPALGERALAAFQKHFSRERMLADLAGALAGL